MAIADSQPLIFDLDSDEPAQDLPWCTVSERDITFYKFFEEIKNSGEGFASSVLVLFEYLMHLRHLARRNLISGTSKQLLYQNRIEDADLSIVNDLATTIWLVFQEKVSSKSSWTRLLSALKETDSSTTFLSLKNVEEIAAVMRENWKEYSKGLNLEENVVKSAVSKRKVNGGSPDSKKPGKRSKTESSPTVELLSAGATTPPQHSRTFTWCMTADTATATADVPLSVDCLLSDEIFEDVSATSLAETKSKISQNICSWKDGEKKDFTAPCVGGALFVRIILYDHQKAIRDSKDQLWRHRVAETSFCLKNSDTEVTKALHSLQQHASKQVNNFY